MRKLLLSAAVVTMAGLSVSAAQPATVDFDFTNDSYGYDRESGTSTNYLDNNAEVKSGAVTLTLTKGEKGNGFRFWSDGLRVNNTYSTTAKIGIVAANANVTGVTMTVKSVTSGLKISVGGKELTADSKVKVYSWTGNAATTALEVVAGSTTTITAISVTYQPLSDKQLPELAYSKSTATALLGQAAELPVLANPHNLAVTYSSSDPAVASVDAAGKVTPLAEGKTEIKAVSAEDATYVAGEAHYTLTVIKGAANLQEALAGGKDSEAYIAFPMTCAYKNGSNTYVTDGTSFTLVFGSTPEYKTGDVIPAGWFATVGEFNGALQLVPKTAPAASTENVGFTPKAVDALTVEMANEVVLLKNVEFAAATPATKSNFTGKVGETSITFRNNFTIASVEAGKYNVTLAVALYKGAVQAYPISYAPAGSSAVEEIEVAGEGVATYYTLQGVRVAEPSQGLYIRVVDGKASKVILK